MSDPQKMFRETLARGQERARQAVHADDVPDWYKVTAVAGARKATVHIYDAIGGWFGVDAQQMVSEINALDVDDIEVHINSPGGSAFDGIAIRNTLRQHEAKVTTVVDGLAASAASIIALAGDTVVMSGGSQMMIHDASGICMGNASDMRDVAVVLDKISNSLAEMYAAKAGGTTEDWRETMRAETWYTASEAVAAGLADRVDVDEPADEDATARFDLTFFAYAGREHAPAPLTPAVAAAQAQSSTRPGDGTLKPPAEPADNTNPYRKESAMSDTLLNGLRDRLGLTADAELTEDQALAALDEALAERAEPTNHTPPAGVVQLDQAQYEDLQAAAKEGREARAQQVADQRALTVDAAVKDGRIPPARREHWVAQLAADPGAVEVLNGLQPGTIPVAAAGYTGGVDEASDDDALLAKAGWGLSEKVA